MKKIIALTLALVMMLSLFSGCAKTEEETAATTTASGNTDETTVAQDSKNEITMAVNTSFATLDPSLISTTAMGAVYANMGASLFKTTEEGSMENDLCESYEVSEDGLLYTFKIKEGLKWSDGQPLTSEHFVYGIKRTIGYGPMNAYAVRNYTKFIAGAKDAAANQADVADMTDVGVNVVDDLTFTVALNEVCPYFLKLFSGNSTTAQRADFVVEHESAWSVNGVYPSIGPMVLQSISPEEQAVFVKNENYWNAENITLDKLTVLVMPDATAQLNAFKAEELDVALNVPTEVATNAQYQDQVHKIEKYTSTYFVLFNVGPKAAIAELQDVNVRKAMTLAVDKGIIIDILGGGTFNIELGGLIPYGFEGNDGDFRSEHSYLDYDLEAAKKLMEDAGYNENNRLSFDYLYSNLQINVDVAQMLQQMWSQIYIDVELKTVEGGVFYDFVDNGEFETCRYANSDSTDPLNYFMLFTSDSQIDGSQAIADPVYDKLVYDAFAIKDQKEYIEQLHKIEQYLVEEMAYVVPLFTQTPVIMVQPNVEGFYTTPGGTPIVTNVNVNN